jgi:hypothetical protein
MLRCDPPGEVSALRIVRFFPSCSQQDTRRRLPNPQKRSFGGSYDLVLVVGHKRNVKKFRTDSSRAAYRKRESSLPAWSEGKIP